jgi:hypothetical protein
MLSIQTKTKEYNCTVVPVRGGSAGIILDKGT